MIDPLLSLHERRWFDRPIRFEVVFEAYFDDSGKESDPSHRFIVMAGYIAIDSVWHQFQQVWSHLLAKHGLPHLHMRTIMGDAKARGWDQAKLNSVLSEFIMATKIGPGVLGFGVAVDADSWRALPPEERNLYGDAQEFCFERTIELVLSRLKFSSQIPPMIRMTFDQDFEYAGRRISILNKLKRRSEAFRTKVLDISFGNSDFFFPLQAADMLAWETRRQLLARSNDATPHPRWAELMAVIPGGLQYVASELWNQDVLDGKVPLHERAPHAVAIPIIPREASASGEQLSGT